MKKIPIIIDGVKLNPTRLYNRIQQLEHRVQLLEKERNIFNKKIGFIEKLKKYFNV